MANLQDIMAYFCKHYLHKDELSKARLTKMTYLADWESAVERGEQISDIQWIYNHYGPYVEDLEVLANSNSLFSIEEATNMHGHSKGIIRLNDPNCEPELKDEEKEILDSVINATHGKYWNEFMEYVYSTYPIRKSVHYAHLNLVELAKKSKTEESS